MKCTKCGRDNRDKAGFCAWCGAALAEATTPAAATDKVAQPQQSSNVCRVKPSLPLKPSAPSDRRSSACARGPSAESAEPTMPTALACGHGAGRSLRGRGTAGEHARPSHLPRQGPAGVCGLWLCKERTRVGRLLRGLRRSLTKPRFVQLMERIQSLPAQYDARFSEGERDYFVTAGKEPETPPSTGAKTSVALRLLWGRATDKGMRREQNEDYVETWYYTPAVLPPETGTCWACSSWRTAWAGTMPAKWPVAWRPIASGRACARTCGSLSCAGRLSTLPESTRPSARPSSAPTRPSMMPASPSPTT